MTAGSNSKLALFDFDGTLTRSDSLWVFLRFYRGNSFFFWKLIVSTPVLIGFKLGIIKNGKAKQRLLSNFLKNDPVDYFEDKCQEFSLKYVPAILNESIFKKFQEHLQENDQVVVVSASIETWIQPWAKQWDVDVLGTKLEQKKGVLTGRFVGKNCNGEEKVKRIKASLNLSQYDEIWAYGDTEGDMPMLELADRPIYRGAPMK